MKDVFVVADNIISPVGGTTAVNFDALKQNISGVQEHLLPAFSPVPFQASLLPEETYTGVAGIDGSFTKFETLLLLSIRQALQNSGIDVQSTRTILVISSTKGNISLLEAAGIPARDKIGLSASAKKIALFFGLANTPLVISNACISGLTALLTGKRLLQMGQYDHAIVAGADIISEFILSGFQSFQAISAQPCRPFDASRNGINLGEAAATVILSVTAGKKELRLSGGAITNDANHISGPSRSGQELCIAIKKAMQQAGVTAPDIGFIAGHGTATLYNDEMEAKAFSLAGMQTVPVNSLKGYYGHTLGAAGIIESVIALQSMQQQLMIGTRGFNQPGVSMPINVCKQTMPLGSNHCLKTASGFGGCNAALVFSKTTV